MGGDASSSVISSSCVNTSGIAMLTTAYNSAAITVATAAMATISMTTAAVTPVVALTVTIKAEKSFASINAAFHKAM